MELSYFTGKLEGVLRYKELPYVRVLKGPIGEVEAATGTAQVPALQIADGRWMTDSTPIIAWLEEKFPHTPIMPSDSGREFFQLVARGLCGRMVVATSHAFPVGLSRER